MRRKKMQNAECRVQSDEQCSPLREKREGYAEGYRQGVRDMAERIKTYYRHTTSKPLPATVEYYVDRLAKEMIEDGKKESDRA